ncbi:hypothetical protein MUO79_01410 [Candidatus Bathyarchaeota archaeon]|nr:hypothetical protein [Candidatus Bathyarchaeota archaeon]
MPTRRVDTSQLQFNKGFKTVLTAIKEERISWNKKELKKQLDEANKLQKETHDPCHVGRFKALSFLYLNFEELGCISHAIEKALVKLKEQAETNT